MPRVMINGVVWCKSEDEILKTAVKKYGENKWEFIASLLSRKTDKQCKARWDTGLDPNIKNIQWTQEEDEKLTNLKKIMSIKIETISLIIRRSTIDCINRYNYLRKTDNEKANDPNRMNLLEKIEENDLQSLPQARARLATTQNKKNKRFTREKQIAVIRRLKHHQRMIEKKRSERTRILNYNSENSIENQTDSYFSDSADEKNEKIKEESQRSKRSRENDIAIDLPENNERFIKKSKVLVVPVPQYSYYNLHAFHDSQFKPSFDFTNNYHILQQCEF